jgi:hypothetical protein
VYSWPLGITINPIASLELVLKVMQARGSSFRQYLNTNCKSGKFDLLSPWIGQISGFLAPWHHNQSHASLELVLSTYDCEVMIKVM